MIVDRASKDFFNAMETKALVAMLDYIDAASDPDAADSLLVKKYGPDGYLMGSFLMAILNIYLFYPSRLKSLIP